jgi:hypothetical protein
MILQDKASMFRNCLHVEPVLSSELTASGQLPIPQLAALDKPDSAIQRLCGLYGIRRELEQLTCNLLHSGSPMIAYGDQPSTRPSHSLRYVRTPDRLHTRNCPAVNHGRRPSEKGRSLNWFIQRRLAPSKARRTVLPSALMPSLQFC